MLTAPAEAAASNDPMELRCRRSKHSNMPSSPAQLKRPCTGEIPHALMPGDLAGIGARNLPSARFSLRITSGVADSEHAMHALDSACINARGFGWIWSKKSAFCKIQPAHRPGHQICNMLRFV